MTSLQEVSHLITDGKHGDCQDESGSGYYFISCKDVRDGCIDYPGSRQITKADYIDTHRRTQLESNDIVITNSGTIGRMALVTDSPVTSRTTFQKSVAIIKPDLEKVVPEWLYYAVMANRDMLIALAGGTAQKNLLLRDLRAFSIEVPPLSAQRIIASILSTYDGLIENNTRRIAMLEEMAQALYREWFVEFCFPGHEKVRMVDSTLGLVPEGWEVNTVEKTFSIMGGGTPSKTVPEYWDGGTINWYSPTDLTKSDSMFMDSSSRQISKLGLEKSSARIFPPFSAMMTSRATLGVISINTTDACTNQGFITCIPNNRFPLYYLFFWLKENVDYFISLGTGSTFKEINKGVFKTIELLIPSKDIVTQCEVKLQSFAYQILNLQRQNNILRQTRDLLLPKLISGEMLPIIVKRGEYDS